MSQDFCEVFFSTVDPKMTVAKVGKKLDGILQRKNIPIIGITWGKNKDPKRNKVIQIESNAMDAVIEEAMTLLSSVASEHEPYASWYLDQAGETLFYCIIDGKVTEFSSAKAVDDYFDQNPDLSPEQVFLSQFEKEQNLLLLRLKIPGKKLGREIDRLCTDYISNPGDKNFEDLKSFIDKLAENEIDFPHLRADKETYRGDIEVAKSLSFFMIRDNYYFLGFNSDNIFDSAKQVIYSNEHSEALNMVAALGWCKGIKDSRAKLLSSQRDADSEWSIYNVPAAEFMCFQMEKGPVNLWRG